MTNTIPNVPRELLADLLGNDHDKRIMAERHLLAMLANAPSPAGVDGLEVVAWQHWGDHTKLLCALGKERGIPGGYTDEFTQPLCRLSDAQAIIDRLRGEVERLQMQLAACGVVALANTIESAGEARQMHQDYMSASCSDVADAVDREIALRAERDDLLQQLAARDEEIERIRVQLMTIASAEPARHSIEWAKAVAATGNNEVYEKWREAFDERDHLAQCLKFARTTMAVVANNANLCGVEYRSLVTEVKRIDAALSTGKEQP